MTTANERLMVLQRQIRECTAQLKDLVENPKKMDSWNDVQLAWMQEYLELLMEETDRVRAKLKKHLENASLYPKD
jgi:hypothetical protein